MLPNEFRAHHRAASESLLRAADDDADRETIEDELRQAEYFEKEAMKHIDTPRQRALGLGLLHAIDMISAVAEAEFLE